MTCLHRVTALVIVVGAAFIATRAAHADPQACAAAAEDGQKLRAVGNLRRARVRLLACAVPACPSIVSSDCARWSAEILATTPTIIVDARDASGHDVGDLEVIVDGEAVASHLDGKAIPIDPGPHTVVFHRAGEPPIIENVIIKEGARGRTLSVRLSSSSSAPPLPSITLPPKPDASATEPVRGHQPWPWVVIAVGGAQTLVGLTMILTTPEVPEGCRTDSDKCATVAGDSATQTRQRVDTYNASQNRPQLGAMIAAVGAAAVMGGIVWHFLERTGPVQAGSLAPWLADSGAGLVGRGSF